MAKTFGALFHDFAGSVVVHATVGWLTLPAVILLGARIRVVETDTIEVSSIPFLALGSWILIVGWFGFNVMSAGAINPISGLVAFHSFFAMVGGTISALIVSKNDAGFVHNGALAGLVAVCAGSDLYHPVWALVVGGVAGLIFVFMFQFETRKLKIDDVLGVWPLHGLRGMWGGLAAGIFGMEALGGSGGRFFYVPTGCFFGCHCFLFDRQFYGKGARSGNIGDGKIFVQDLDRCIRIRTGEEGNDAVG